MAAQNKRTTWVDHWTIHQDGDELHQDAIHANSAPEAQDSYVPRYGGMALTQGELGATKETALSLATGEGSNSVPAGQNSYFGVTGGDNEAHGLGYIDTSDNGRRAMEVPTTLRAARNQLGQSRWAPATKAKGSSIWLDPPKKFVKASDQNLMSPAPFVGSTHPKDNTYVPPHLRQNPTQAQKKAPEPEPELQQRFYVTPTRVAQHDAPRKEPRDDSPIRLTPDSLSSPIHREAAATSAFPAPKGQMDGISTLNSSLEASLAIFGVDPPKANPNRDPRGEVPVQTWIEQDWNQTRRPKKKNKSFESESIARDSEVSGATSALNWAPDSRMTEWIGKWTDNIPGSVEASVFHDRPTVHEECDVDCETGRLLAPVEYPRTMISKLGSRTYNKQHTDIAQIRPTRPTRSRSGSIPPPRPALLVTVRSETRSSLDENSKSASRKHALPPQRSMKTRNLP